MSIIKKLFGKGELPLCKCGCGNQVERKSKKYFEDHFRNPPTKKEVEEVKEVVSAPVKEKKVAKPAKKVAPKTKGADLSKMPKIRKASSVGRDAKRKQLLKNMGGSNAYLGR